MKEKIRWMALLTLSAGISVALLICTGLISVQAKGHENDNDQGNDNDQEETDHHKHPPHPKPSPSPQVYNPYPSGILPADLTAEINRVLREIDVIENRAIQRWHSLQPPVMTNQPPILQNTGTEAIETLGELMNYDKNIAPGKNQACASC